MDTSDAFAFFHGFELPYNCFDYREIGLCTMNRTDHCLLEYACGPRHQCLFLRSRKEHRGLNTFRAPVSL